LLASMTVIGTIASPVRLLTPETYIDACKPCVFFVGWGTSGYNDFDAVKTKLLPILRDLDTAYPGWKPTFGGDPPSDGGIGRVVQWLKQDKNYAPIAVAADQLLAWSSPVTDQNAAQVFYYPTQYTTSAAKSVEWGGTNPGAAVYNRSGHVVKPTPHLLGATAYYLGHDIIAKGNLKAIVAVGGGNIGKQELEYAYSNDALRNNIAFFPAPCLMNKTSSKGVLQCAKNPTDPSLPFNGPGYTYLSATYKVTSRSQVSPNSAGSPATDCGQYHPFFDPQARLCVKHCPTDKPANSKNICTGTGDDGLRGWTNGWWPTVIAVCLLLLIIFCVFLGCTFEIWCCLCCYTWRQNEKDNVVVKMTYDDDVLTNASI